jgi:hypothetical protein
MTTLFEHKHPSCANALRLTIYMQGVLLVLSVIVMAFAAYIM